MSTMSVSVPSARLTNETVESVSIENASTNVRSGVDLHQANLTVLDHERTLMYEGKVYDFDGKLHVRRQGEDEFGDPKRKRLERKVSRGFNVEKNFQKWKKLMDFYYSPEKARAKVTISKRKSDIEFKIKEEKCKYCQLQKKSLFSKLVNSGDLSEHVMLGLISKPIMAMMWLNKSRSLKRVMPIVVDTCSCRKMIVVLCPEILPGNYKMMKVVPTLSLETIYKRNFSLIARRGNVETLEQMESFFYPYEIRNEVYCYLKWHYDSTPAKLQTLCMFDQRLYLSVYTPLPEHLANHHQLLEVQNQPQTSVCGLIRFYFGEVKKRHVYIFKDFDRPCTIFECFQCGLICLFTYPSRIENMCAVHILQEPVRFCVKGETRYAAVRSFADLQYVSQGGIDFKECVKQCLKDDDFDFLYSKGGDGLSASNYMINKMESLRMSDEYMQETDFAASSQDIRSELSERDFDDMFGEVDSNESMTIQLGIPQYAIHRVPSQVSIHSSDFGEFEPQGNTKKSPITEILDEVKNFNLHSEKHKYLKRLIQEKTAEEWVDLCHKGSIGSLRKLKELFKYYNIENIVLDRFIFNYRNIQMAKELRHKERIDKFADYYLNFEPEMFNGTVNKVRNVAAIGDNIKEAAANLSALDIDSLNEIISDVNGGVVPLVKSTIEKVNVAVSNLCNGDVQSQIVNTVEKIEQVSESVGNTSRKIDKFIESISSSFSSLSSILECSSVQIIACLSSFCLSVYDIFYCFKHKLWVPLSLRVASFLCGKVSQVELNDITKMFSSIPSQVGEGESFLPQSDGKTKFNFVDAISKCCCLGIKGMFKTLDQKEFETFKVSSMGIASLNSIICAATSIFSKVTSLLSWVVEYVSKWLAVKYGLNWNVLKMCEDDRLRKLADEFTEIQNEILSNSIVTQDGYTRVRVFMRDLDKAMMDAISQKSVSNLTASLITAIRTRVNKWEEEAPLLFRTAGLTRARPFWVHFHGAPGIGKSEIMSYLVGYTYAGLIGAEEKKWDQLCFARNLGAEFWDGYNGQPICLMNDIFQTSRDETAMNNGIMELTRCNDSTEYMLNMAFAKGKIYFNSRLLITDSQQAVVTETVKQYCASGGDHLVRRIGMSVEVVLRQKYANQKGRVDKDTLKSSASPKVYGLTGPIVNDMYTFVVTMPDKAPVYFDTVEAFLKFFAEKAREFDQHEGNLKTEVLEMGSNLQRIFSKMTTEDICAKRTFDGEKVDCWSVLDDNILLANKWKSQAGSQSSEDSDASFHTIALDLGENESMEVVAWPEWVNIACGGQICICELDLPYVKGFVESTYNCNCDELVFMSQLQNAEKKHVCCSFEEWIKVIEEREELKRKALRKQDIADLLRKLDRVVKTCVGAPIQAYKKCPWVKIFKVLGAIVASVTLGIASAFVWKYRDCQELIFEARDMKMPVIKPTEEIYDQILRDVKREEEIEVFGMEKFSDEDNQRIQKRKVKKNHKVYRPHSFIPDQNEDELNKQLMKAFVRFIIKKDGQIFESLSSGLQVFGDVFLLPTHVVVTLCKYYSRYGEKIEFYLERPRSKENTYQRFYPQDFGFMKKLENQMSDLFFVQIKRVSLGPNLIKHFISEKDTPVLHESFLYGLRSTRHTCNNYCGQKYCEGERSLVEMVHLYSTSMQTTVDAVYDKFQGESKNYVARVNESLQYNVDVVDRETNTTLFDDYGVEHLTFYHYLVQTGPGDCGMLLLHRDKKVRGKILGMHVAGNQAYGAANPIYREDLEKAFEYFETYIPPDTGKYLSHSEASDKFSEELREKLTLDWHGSVAKYTNVKGKECSWKVNLPNKTRIKKSVFFDMLETVSPHCKLPARLDCFKNEAGEKVSPLINGLKKLTGVTNMIPETAYLVIAQHINDSIQMWDSKLDSPRRILSIEEALNGIEGMRQVDVTTSAGFPFIKLATVSNKTPWLEIEVNPTTLQKTLYPTEDLKDLIGARIEMAKNRQFAGTIFFDCLKDELRPLEKVKCGKTRIFQVGPFDLCVVLRMYFGCFISHCQTSFLSGEMSIGINPDSMDWTILANRLLSTGHNFMCGDYSNYDASISMQLGMLVADVANGFYNDSEENKMIRRVLIATLFTTDHIIGHSWYRSQQGNPSGDALTTIINCVVNMALLRYAWLKLVSTNLTLFNKHVCAVFYGDDNLVALSDQVCPHLNMFSYQEVMSTLNITFTSATKEEITMPYVQLSDASYLKRKFKWHEEMEVYLAPMPEEEIWEIPRWSESDPSIVDDQIQRFNSAIMFMAHHGKEKTDEMVKIFRNMCNDFNLKEYKVDDCYLKFDTTKLFTYDRAMTIMFAEKWKPFVELADQKLSFVEALLQKASGAKPPKSRQTADDIDGLTLIGRQITKIANYKEFKPEMCTDMCGPTMNKAKLKAKFDKNVTLPAEAIALFGDEAAKCTECWMEKHDIFGEMSWFDDWQCWVVRKYGQFAWQYLGFPFTTWSWILYFMWRSEGSPKCVCAGEPQSSALNFTDQIIAMGKEIKERNSPLREEILASKFRPQSDALELGDEKGSFTEERTKFEHLDVCEQQKSITKNIFEANIKKPVMDTWFKTPILVKQYTWTPTFARDANMFTLRFPDVYIASSRNIQDRLKQIAFWQPDFTIEIKVTSTPFHGGAFNVSWMPQNDTNAPEYDSVVARSQLQNCFTVFAASDEVLKFSVPYTHYAQKIRVQKLLKPDLFTVFFDCLSSLTSTNPNPSAVDISVWAYMTEPRLTQYKVSQSLTLTERELDWLVAKQANPLLEPLAETDEFEESGYGKTVCDTDIASPRYGKFYKKRVEFSGFKPEFEAESEQPPGLISGAARKVSDMAGVLTAIPVIGSVASMIDKGAKAIGGVASLLGMSIPVSSEPTHGMQNRQPRVQKVEDVTNSVVLGPTQGTEVAKDFSCVNGDGSFNSINKYCQRRGMLARTPITKDTAAGQILAIFRVNPIHGFYLDASNNIWPTPYKFVANLHAMVRGGTKFGFLCPCPIGQSFTYRISYIADHPYQVDPVPADFTPDDLINCASMVVNVKGLTSTVLTVPYSQKAAWIDIGDATDTGMLGESFCNGYLVLSMVNKLACMEAQPVDTEIIWYISGAEDTQFAMPSLQFANDRGNFYFAQSDSCTDPCMSTQAWLKSSFPCITGKESGVEHNRVETSFETTSFKQLTNQLQPVLIMDKNLPHFALSVNPFGWINSSNPLLSFTSYVTMIPTVFKYYRGGMRVHISPGPNGGDVDAQSVYGYQSRDIITPIIPTFGMDSTAVGPYRRGAHGAALFRATAHDPADITIPYNCVYPCAADCGGLRDLTVKGTYANIQVRNCGTCLICLGGGDDFIYDWPLPIPKMKMGDYSSSFTQYYNYMKTIFTMGGNNGFSASLPAGLTQDQSIWNKRKGATTNYYAPTPYGDDKTGWYFGNFNPDNVAYHIDANGMECWDLVSRNLSTKNTDPWIHYDSDVVVTTGTIMYCVFQVPNGYQNASSHSFTFKYAGKYCVWGPTGGSAEYAAYDGKIFPMPYNGEDKTAQIGDGIYAQAMYWQPAANNPGYFNWYNIHLRNGTYDSVVLPGGAVKGDKIQQIRINNSPDTSAPNFARLTIYEFGILDASGFVSDENLTTLGTALYNRYCTIGPLKR